MVAVQGGSTKDATGTGQDRIQGLLGGGWDLLAAGRSREAADLFGRVLLQNAGHADARRGLEKARAAAAEEARLLDVRIEEALAALGSGDKPRARSLLEDVVRRGGDRDRALVLLDRMEDRGGRLDTPSAPVPNAAAVPLDLPVARRAWSRRAFAIGWAFVLAVLAAGLAFSWEQFVDVLVRTPSPSSQETELRGPAR